MSEYFLELFTEEIPPGLQKNARENLLKNFRDFFEKKNIRFSKDLTFSTPNRLLILFDGIKPEIKQKEEEIRGPKFESHEKALEGFLRANNLQKKDLYQKENDKYHDMIQGDFKDNYYNNTLKTLMGLKWAYLFCESDYYLFADDDYYISTKNLLLFLKDPIKYEEYSDTTTIAAQTYYKNYCSSNGWFTYFGPL